MASEDLFVGGKWLTGYGRTFQSKNPATLETIWEGSRASESDVDRAVAAARSAVYDWANLPLQERLSYIEKFAQELEAAESAFIDSISMETGKPYWESKMEFAAMKGKIAISIEAYNTRCPEIEKGPSLTRHKPHGVIAVLGPFNFPGHLPNGHIIPALIAGNTLVFKPSEYTPLVGKAITKCWERVGLPAGVFNMVQGGKDVGRPLSQHSGIDGLFFTGSYGTGKALAEHFSKHPGKILALELGGNNPLIVSEVKDTAAAVYHTIQSAYITAGQRCTCARRLIIEDNQDGQNFLEALMASIRKLRVGAPHQTPEPFMGPMIHEDAVVKVLSKQAAWIAEGAHSLIPFTHLKEGTGLVSPGLIDVTPMEERKDEEVFGPLLQLIRVNSFDEAIEEANNTDFGLAAGILTDSKEKWEQFDRSVRAGVVNWNTPSTGASSAAPFGGIGKSGNYHPSAYYAADYCAYPVASMLAEELKIPQNTPPGLE